MYTIDQKTHQDIMTFLGEVPSKFAIPLINLFSQKAKEAQDSEPTIKSISEVADENK